MNTCGVNEPVHSVEAPFGSWSSPLTPLAAASGSSRFGEVQLLGSDVIWVESRPGYVRRAAMFVSDPRTATNSELLQGAQISARTSVNEYGGGAFWVHGDPRTDGRVYWVDAGTQRLMSAGADANPRELMSGVAAAPPTAPPERYAAGVVTPDGGWMICERESLHLTSKDRLPSPTGAVAKPEVANELVALSTTHGESVLLVGRGQAGSGDFTASPVLSADGANLAWLRWDHPNMPWDAAELWAAKLHYGDDGSIGVSQPRRVAGGRDGGEARGLDRAVSVCLPQWSPDGCLWWCDDSSDWWHLYCSKTTGLPDEGSGDLAAPLISGAEEEVGEPRWIAGGSRYGFTEDGFVVFAARSGGFDSLWSFHLTTRERLPLPGPKFSSVDSLSVQGRSVAVIAGQHDQPSSVFHIDLSTGVVTDLRSAQVAETTTSDVAASDVGASAQPPLGAEWVSTPRHISFPTGTSPDSGAQAHALFYPPQSPTFRGPQGEAPPLLVRIHGGPTAAARAEFSPSVLFWTSRGFAVVDVNYRGSTGYGRKFRDQLLGEWGVADVQDCIAAARFLSEQGLVDAARCVIRGGSAGGFTALAALCFQQQWGFADTFVAACSLYGVTDLAALAADTHKFESRYLDGLVGPLPEAADTYRERSPLFHAEHLTQPVLLLQGEDDKVVPPAQAEVLVAALEHNQVPHAYVLFKGEGHGFLKQETVVKALETELAFYGQVLRFLPDGREPAVENLVGWPPAPSSGRMGA